MPHACHSERSDLSFRAQRRVIPSAATGHAEPFASLRVNAARNLSGWRTTPRAARGDNAGYAPVIGMRGERGEAGGARREARGTRRGVIPMTIDDAACWSFRALRFAQGKRSDLSFRAQRRVIPSAATGHAEPFASLRVNAARNRSGWRTTPRAARGDHAGWSQGIGISACSRRRGLRALRAGIHARAAASIRTMFAVATPVNARPPGRINLGGGAAYAPATDARAR
ncbi:MAG: hypothetical protein KatS3mg058_4262 [Roseiflexus sp.]|nr:MAG: hypothetical protein KatS3mg058_4262 [Roseiflexus sp.]